MARTTVLNAAALPEAPAPTPPELAGSRHRDRLPDRLRQAANVALALAQPLAAYFAFAGTTFEEATGSAAAGVPPPPVVPADYAVGIWAAIYAGAVGYAVYQALPGRREDVLLRRIGWNTASAFLATASWLLAARLGLLWLTVLCIFWIFVALVPAYLAVAAARREGLARSRAEWWLVALPVGLHLGYTTVATVANTAAVVKERVVPGLAPAPETVASVAMLLGAGAVAALLARRGRGNPGYAPAVLWGLGGIVVANTLQRPNTPVALAAAGVAALVAAAAWLRKPSPGGAG